MEKEAFYSAPLDEEIVIPDSVTYIGAQAFTGSVWDEDYHEIPTGPKQVAIGGGLRDLGWNAFRKDAVITTVLNSQRNLCVTSSDLEKIPRGFWDGKTDIPFNDGSCVPPGKPSP